VSAQTRLATGKTPADTDPWARGFMGTLADPLIRAKDGTVVFDANDYAFLAGAAPDAGTADAELWEHSRRTALHGLFEVVPGLYQVRGLDLANLTIVEGRDGIIVIDALSCSETAAAALDLYAAHRGARRVTALILTHPHADHFGGAAAVLERATEDAPVLAPEGFLEHAVSENVQVGPAMGRRATYMYGTALPPGPDAHLGCGLGPRLAAGTLSLPRPTRDVTPAQTRHVVDGTELVFQLTPGTEAPVEMNLFLPHLGALCLAENAVHTMHNLVTLRGAPVRDARSWAEQLRITARLFAADSTVAFATHHWPVWGSRTVREYLRTQAEVYAYLHDQTVRLMNLGHTPAEIAEELVLPPRLADSPAGRGFYGSLSHNVKGIYQRYLGWYDANPAHLWPLPPREQGRQWVRLLGGPDAAVAAVAALLDTAPEPAGGEALPGADAPAVEAREGLPSERLRFAATVLDHVVFGAPNHDGARRLLARVHTALGRGARNATWRNAYLTAALELQAARPDTPETPTGTASATATTNADPARSARPGHARPAAGGRLGAALGVCGLLDALAVRVDGPAAWDLDLRLELEVTDTNTTHVVRLRDGVLSHVAEPTGSAALAAADPWGPARDEARLTLVANAVGPALQGETVPGVRSEGAPETIRLLRSVIRAPDRNFNVVAP
jgi:alkyl sulfatase BDS1-like metallo-beta-lactamase superfamily hydrolase